jgi:N-acetylneuraminic acid mutarotase
MRIKLGALLVVAGLQLAAGPVQAEQYPGNGNTDFGGAIGNGTLTLTDDGTNISGTLTVGGSMNDVLVLYIQTGPGGFTDTSGFNDQGDACRQAISGVSASGRSLLTFANGFQPNYALALAPTAAGTGGLWQLANGYSNSLVYSGSINLAPVNDSGPYTFSFPAALIGMIPGVRSTIQVFGTYVRSDGSRSTEAIAGNLTGTPGWHPFTQTAYANYTFDAGSVLVKLPLGVWTQHASGVPPAARGWHTAVWTGSKMIVWGGYNSTYLNDGGRYNPAANSWTALSTNGAPAARWFHTAVWTGSELMVWGGQGSSGYLNDGGRYNPVTDSWTALPTNGAPAARAWHTAVWTGSEMIVWGGIHLGGGFGYGCNDGGRYDPTGNSWTAVPTNGAPAARAQHTTVWTGSEMIIWGGGLNDGGRYNPTPNSWTALPTTGAPAARYDHTAVWTGSEMIIWGGANGTSSFFNDGGCYTPAASVWTALPANGALAARSHHTAVWSGSEMIVWGGRGAGYFNDGGRYNPTANSWTGVPTNGAPAARWEQTAAWTGCEMIIFGGVADGAICLSDTWSYYPYAPAVRLTLSSPTSADVAWPVWYPTLRLCQTTNPAAGQWTPVTNAVTQVGSENHVTVSPLSSGQFFRAVYP